MRKQILLLIILINAICQVMAQNTGISRPTFSKDSIIRVTYSDTFNKVGASQSPALKVPILSKEERYSAEAGKITITFSDKENTPPEVVTCANLAASIWESVIKADQGIVITANYTPLLDNGDIVTDVYYVTPVDKDFAYPLAMAQLGGSNSNIESGGEIKINSDVDWDFSVGESVDSNKCNLTFGLLRAIGRVLGFGSSVAINDNDDYYFLARQAHTIFDSMIVSSDGLKLTDIPVIRGRPNPELKEFVNYPGRKFFFADEDNRFELASGPYNTANPPLTAFNSGLMCADISAGDYFIKVDDDVWKCMEMIGWPMERKDEIKIMCDDSDSTGLMDAFSKHTFYLNNDTISLSQAQWILTLPGKDGQDIVTTYRGDSGKCVIPALSKNDIYAHGADGLVKGRLEFQGNINGIPMKLYPYTIYFETAPQILDAKILGFEFTEDGEFIRAKFQVRYYGADSIEMYTEEEYGSLARSQIIKEPAIATSTSAWMYAGGYTWLNFIVKNNYGRAVYILEIEPYAADWYPLENPDQYLAPGQTSVQEVDFSSDDNTVIYAYDVYGSKIWSGNSIDNLKSVDYKGLVILRINKNGKTRTVKTIL